MTRFDAWTVGTLLIAGLLTTAGAIVVLQPRAQQDTVDTPGEAHLADTSPAAKLTAGGDTDRSPFQQMDNTTDETAPPGGFVSSIVRMERSNVDATVTIEQFNTRFSAARTETARADVVASSLNASRQQVLLLENSLATIDARRMNGTINEEWFDIELSWLLAAAESQERVLQRLERATQSLSQEELAERNATVDTIEQIRNRVDRLLANDDPDIHRTTFDRQFYSDLAMFFDRFNAAPDTGSGEFEMLFEGQWVNVYIASDRGPPAILSFRATDDTRMVDLRAGRHPDGTVRMEMDEETASELLTTDTPRRSFSTALREDEISINEVEP